MGVIRKVTEKAQDVAGGVGGTREATGEADETDETAESRFESQEERRAKQPGDNLPRPEGQEA